MRTSTHHMNDAFQIPRRSLPERFDMQKRTSKTLAAAGLATAIAAAPVCWGQGGQQTTRQFELGSPIIHSTGGQRCG